MNRISSIQAMKGLDILQGVDEAVREGHPADVALSRIFKASPSFGARDRRFYAGMVYAWYRWRGWTDPEAQADAVGVLGAMLQEAYELDDHLRALAHEASVAKERLQPAGEMDWTARAAAVAQLRGLEQPPALELLAPAWVGGQVAFEGPEREAWYRALQVRPPVWLRVSPQRMDSVAAFLTEQGVESARHPRVPGALRAGKPLPAGWLARPPLNTVEIQDVSSQAVGLACAPAAGEQWWDACAGSGGKTLQLAAALGGQGHVLASDIRPAILEQLQRRLRRSGIQGVSVRSIDASAAQEQGPFDGVLVDAPCSGSGTWARNPDARWRVAEKDLRKLQRRQLQILQGASIALKPGGKLVYAVCSSLRAETVEVHQAFLGEHPGFAPQPFAHPLTGAPCEGQAWCKPWEEACTGMYIAVYTRAR